MTSEKREKEIILFVKSKLKMAMFLYTIIAIKIFTCAHIKKSIKNVSVVLIKLSATT